MSVTSYVCDGNSTASSVLTTMGGNVSVTGTCNFTGDLVLDGSKTKTITVNGATFNLAGNLILSNSASFSVIGGTFRLANQFVFQYAISTADAATFTMQNAELSTNDGTVAGTTTSNFTGSGTSTLQFTDVTIDTQHSWLLAAAYNNSHINVSNSQAPVEIYPYDSATISVSGPSSNIKIWLDFPAGSNTSITNLSDDSKPYTFNFGAGTPDNGLVSSNVQYQVHITNAPALLGFTSHPDSSVIITAPQGPTTYAYIFDSPAAPINVNGEFVVSQGSPISTLLNDSGRTLQLVNVPLVPIAWQVYSGAANGTSLPVTISGSTVDSTKFVTLNEVGAFNGGNFVLNTVTCLWATVTAVGTGRIAISNSQIASQTINAADTGQITITGTPIYGSLIQATGNAVVKLINAPLLQVDAVPNPAPAGFPALALNPTMPDPSAYPTFVTNAGGLIVDATIDPVASPISAGSTINFTGNAFAVSQMSLTCTFNLSYQGPSATSFTPITTGAACPTQSRTPGGNLGTLNTMRLSAGTYTVMLELYLNGTPTIAAQATFTLN